ncbi:MAG: hypothetical protein JNK29_09765, partial [Anaerolineales bacterium]|nr:hypothetical protein [Anaerolineales bacterium]
LAATYVALIVGLQSLSAAFGAQRPEWITVVSTLASAALAAPLRSRLQAVIDQRFYRRKYDAGRTLAAFAAAARDETRLERLVEQLAGIVEEALQPETLTLWLARPPHGRPAARNDSRNDPGTPAP